ncbi:MAG TPA: phage holin family protein [Candidatus Paceibacterota bacterium]|nr:phage holin family protein [Candidatus Paceibacterota bacterium]
MHWLFKVILTVLGNALALWLANLWIPGFVIGANVGQLVVIGLILAVLNAILKPVLTLILGPIIFLTLGLGIVIVNAIILYLLSVLADHLDFLHGSVTIHGIPALFFATIIVSVINFVIHAII